MRDALSDAIRTIVLPRMLHQRQTRQASQQVNQAGGPEAMALAHAIAQLRACVTAADPTPSEAVLAALKQNGTPRQQVLLDVFVPVARDLMAPGRGDVLTFADRTLGFGRLRSLIRSDAMPEPPPAMGRHGRILIMHGQEHHIFWPAVVEDLFRSAGWDTTISAETHLPEMARASHDMLADVIALVVPDARSLPDLTAAARVLDIKGHGRVLAIVGTGSAAGGQSRSGRHPHGLVQITDMAQACAMAKAMLTR
jgi:hypothetical protein